VGRRDGVIVVALDIAQVEHPQVAQLHLVVAIPGREPRQRLPQGRRREVGIAWADGGAMDRSAKYRDVGGTVAAAGAEPLAGVQLVASDAARAMGMRTSRSTDAAQASA
jgi:hypothetical protein